MSSLDSKDLHYILQQHLNSKTSSSSAIANSDSGNNNATEDDAVTSTTGTPQGVQPSSQGSPCGSGRNDGGESGSSSPPSSATTSSGSGSSKKQAPNNKPATTTKDRSHLRKGKWTREEEEYTTRIIHHFRSGLLKLPEGSTLRSFLAEKLNCDPMRITKKFAGASLLGKRVYHFGDKPHSAQRDVESAKNELAQLEHRFHLREEHGNNGIPLQSLAQLVPLSSANPSSGGNSTTASTFLDGSAGARGVYTSPPGAAAGCSGVLPVNMLFQQQQTHQPLHLQLPQPAPPSVGMGVNNNDPAAAMASFLSQVMAATGGTDGASSTPAPAPATSSGGAHAPRLPFAMPSSQQQLQSWPNLVGQVGGVGGAPAAAPSATPLPWMTGAIPVTTPAGAATPTSRAAAPWPCFPGVNMAASGAPAPVPTSDAVPAQLRSQIAQLGNLIASPQSEPQSSNSENDGGSSLAASLQWAQIAQITHALSQMAAAKAAACFRPPQQQQQVLTLPKPPPAAAAAVPAGLPVGLSPQKQQQQHEVKRATAATSAAANSKAAKLSEQLLLQQQEAAERKKKRRQEEEQALVERHRRASLESVASVSSQALKKSGRSIDDNSAQEALHRFSERRPIREQTQATSPAQQPPSSEKVGDSTRTNGVTDQSSSNDNQDAGDMLFTFLSTLRQSHESAMEKVKLEDEQQAKQQHRNKPSVSPAGANHNHREETGVAASSSEQVFKSPQEMPPPTPQRHHGQARRSPQQGNSATRPSITAAARAPRGPASCHAEDSEAGKTDRSSGSTSQPCDSTGSDGGLSSSANGNDSDDVVKSSDDLSGGSASASEEDGKTDQSGSASSSAEDQDDSSKAYQYSRGGGALSSEDDSSDKDCTRNVDSKKIPPRPTKKTRSGGVNNVVGEFTSRNVADHTTRTDALQRSKSDALLGTNFAGLVCSTKRKRVDASSPFDSPGKRRPLPPKKRRHHDRSH